MSYSKEGLQVYMTYLRLYSFSGDRRHVAMEDGSSDAMRCDAMRCDANLDGRTAGHTGEERGWMDG
jgi:hypothetical protein